MIGSLAAILTLLAVFAQEDVNRLTAEEEAAGFELLFDGKSTHGWRGFQAESAPAGWQAEDGALARVGEGGDLISEETFDDFELRFEWKVEAGSNSGVFFRVSEDAAAVWETAPEMQVLDNAGHADGKSPLTSAGSNYALHGPPEDVTRPVGEWNRARIVVEGRHVEHWLNGVKIVDYELLSPEWEALVAKSKFAGLKRYGREPSGHIAIQDHGDPVFYRGIKIRRLGAN